MSFRQLLRTNRRHRELQSKCQPEQNGTEEYKLET